MLAWLGITGGVAFGSAVFPLISVELFLVGLVSDHHHHPPMSCWLLGAVVALGQVAGKLVYFYASRGAVALPAFMRPNTSAAQRRTRWRVAVHWASRWFGVLRAKCERHPGWLLGTTGISAVTGIPPFMAMTMLAGVARMPVGAFLCTTLLGRFLRFSAIAAAPALVLRLV